MHLQEKENIHDSDDYEVKNTQTICALLGTIPKENPLEPLKGTKPRSRKCQHRYTRKRTEEGSSALKKRIEVKKADLKNQRRQIARPVKERVEDSYSFLPDEQRSEKQNSLYSKVVLILFTHQPCLPQYTDWQSFPKSGTVAAGTWGKLLPHPSPPHPQNQQ